jgi:hypothetical protein
LSAAAALATALAGSGHASDCPEDVGVFPSVGDALALSGRLVVVTPGWYGSAPRRENVQYELRSVSERVPLRIRERYADANGVWAVVVTAVHALRPATRYVLYVDGEPANPQNYGVRGPQVGWKTSTQVDARAPRWVARPRLSGPASEPYLTVRVSVQDASPVQILAEVHLAEFALPIGHGMRTRRLLVPADGVIRIGNIPCLGFFDLGEGHSYALELTAIDSSGNRSAAPAVLTFEGPEWRRNEDLSQPHAKSRP